MARFFLLDAAVIQEFAPDLSAAGDPNHVRSRHAAATLLGHAGETLLGAATGLPEDGSDLTSTLGWLMFENWECIVPSSTDEKRAFSSRLEGILADLDAEISSGLIDGSSDAVPPARETILAVIAWYRGKRRETGRPIVSALALHPVPVRVLSARTRESIVPPGINGVALSPDELALLAGGHTLHVHGVVSGGAAAAIEKVCSKIVRSFSDSPDDYSTCDFFRMSVDGKWLFACPGFGLTMPWVFAASIENGFLMVGDVPPIPPNDEFERLGLDIDEGLFGAENAKAVEWCPGALAQ